MDGGGLVLFAVGTLLVRLGMGFQQTGLVRAKNSAGAVMRTIGDVTVCVLAFWLLGAALLFPTGGNGILSIDLRYVAGGMPTLAIAPALVLVMAGTLLAGGIVTGAMSERSRFYPMLVVSAVIAGVLVPVAGYWAWGDNGWLGRLGFRDAAGAGVIHLSGAMVAGVGAILVGARNGKYNRDGSSNAIPGHNMPLARLGSVIVVVAWVAYVGGFTAVHSGAERIGLAALNLLVGGSAGALATLIFCQLRYGKPDIHLTFDGLLGALVALSASADLVGPRSAVLIGAVAGLAVPFLTLLLDLFYHVDDPVGAIAAHGGGGAWGLVAAGLLVPGTLAERIKATGVQLLGLVAIAGLSVGVGVAIFGVLKARNVLRSKEADEWDGLDLAEHDIGAYPDFQQTTIKSYHLREA